MDEIKTETLGTVLMDKLKEDIEDTSSEVLAEEKAEKLYSSMSFKELVFSVPKRIMALVNKMISFKFMIFIVATGMLYLGKVESWVWLVIAGVVIFGHEFFKYAENILGKK